MKFEEILFVFRNPNQGGTDSSQVSRVVSCRLVTPLSRISEDPRPLGESIDANIISMCVEQAAGVSSLDSYRKVFHICTGCGSEIPENGCAKCLSQASLGPVFPGGMIVPEKVRRFLVGLGLVFGDNQGVSRESVAKNAV